MKTKEQIKAALIISLLFLGFLFIATRPTKAEYHHCMVTTIDKSICESLK